MAFKDFFKLRKKEPKVKRFCGRISKTQVYTDARGLKDGDIIEHNLSKEKFIVYDAGESSVGFTYYSYKELYFSPRDMFHVVGFLVSDEIPRQPQMYNVKYYD